MLRSITISCFSVFVAVALALALRSRPAPLPEPTAQSVTVAVPAVVPAPAIDPPSPALVQVDEPEGAVVAIVDSAAIARQAVERLGKHPDNASNWTAEELRSFLDELGLEVDPQDQEQAKRIDASMYRFKERLNQVAVDYMARLSEIHQVLEAQGRYVDEAPGERKEHARPKHAHTVSRVTIEGGATRTFVVDAQEFPELFAERKDRIGLAAMSFVSEAIAAVREPR